MYVKPEVTRYGGKELLDLMGPVETGYCDIEVQEQAPCQKELRVNTPTDLDDYRERLGWQITPADPGGCSDDDDSGVIPGPADGCFGDITDGDGYFRVPVDVCCLAECVPNDQEEWTLGLTLFRDNGSEDTCDIDLLVGENG